MLVRTSSCQRSCEVGDILLLRTCFKSIFMRNRSLSNTRWFYAKKCKIGKENLYLTENWLSRNEIRCAADNHNYMCHICAKGFSNLNFN